jgi:propanol-preferring alcohol dehydrogenase
VVPADHVVPLPVNIDAIESGTIGCALGTAFHAVVTRGAAKPGEVVAVLGSGGVGLHALQVARATGAYTVAVDIGQPKLDAARRMGANEAFLAHEAAELLADLTSGGGADLVVDCVGTATSQAIALTRKGGRIVQVGYTTSEAQYPPLATDELALRELTVIGSRYFSRPELVSAVNLVARGLVRPVVAEVLPLCEVNAGLEQIRAEKAVGRVVVRVADQ